MTRTTPDPLAGKDLEYPRERYPHDSPARFHLQHAHLLSHDLDAAVDFWTRWFDADVKWDGDYAGSRNVFMKIGIGALHFYEQPPKDEGKGAIHHLGVQVVGIEDLYERMEAAGLDMGPKPGIRSSEGSKYFMFMAPDNILLELFEVSAGRDKAVLDYYGMPEVG